MFLSFIGAPGSGKGTQAHLLSQKLQIPHLSIGDLIRKEMRQASPYGQYIARKLKNHKNLKQRKNTIHFFETLAMELLAKRVEREDCQRGVILDGFPRTNLQARKIKETIQHELDGVIHIQCEDEQILTQRVRGRLVCPACLQIFNITFHEDHQLCSYCQTPLETRYGDKQNIFQNRLEEYAQTTRQILPYFKAQNILFEIDGNQQIENVHKDIIHYLKLGGISLEL